MEKRNITLEISSLISEIISLEEQLKVKYLELKKLRDERQLQENS